MKAIQSIGFKKALRFFWYGWFSWLLHVSLPPIRVWLLRLAGASIGKDTVLFDVKFSNLYHYGFKKLNIENRVFLGDEVMLDVRGGVVLEDDVTVSNRVTIVSHSNVGFEDHPLQKKYPTKESLVVIKSGAYIGTGAIILPGVTIGRESIVGAGSVVTRDVPDHVLVAGVPTKIKKKLSIQTNPHLYQV